MIDVDHQISQVARKVGDRTLEAGEARVVTVAQTYAADLDDVWDACTNPERIPRWFIPVSGELRVGGRFQLQGHAGGVIERCDPPNGFAATWEFDGNVSWIELRLRPEDGGTRFELDHLSVVGEHWEQFGPSALGIGWDSILSGLALNLADPAVAVDQAEAMAFMASPEGIRFLQLSCEAWYEADVAGGADKDVARAAADRALAAYTGQPAS